MNKLNNSYKAAIITFGGTLIGFIATIFLFFINLMEVPLGILLGGLIFGGLSLLTGLAETKDEEAKESKRTIIMIITKFVLSLGLIVLIAVLYYKLGFKIINLFAFIGVYTFNTIVTVIIYLVSKK